jgi:hypothetical protein
MVVQEVKAFSLGKRFLLTEIFPKYPNIEVSIKKGSSDRYKKNVRQRLLKYRKEHMQEVNRKSSYKAINIGLKAEHDTLYKHEANCHLEIKLSKCESDLNYVL